MTAEFLKEVSPFLAILVSILALTIGPHITGRVARAQAVAQMREKWIYSFRELLTDLTTEFDMAPEMRDQEGVVFQRGAVTDWDYMRKLRAYQNSVLLMANRDDPVHKELTTVISEVIHSIFFGIKNYTDFYEKIDRVKILGHEVIKQEWSRVLP